MCTSPYHMYMWHTNCTCAFAHLHIYTCAHVYILVPVHTCTYNPARAQLHVYTCIGHWHCTDKHTSCSIVKQFHSHMMKWRLRRSSQAACKRHSSWPLPSRNNLCLQNTAASNNYCYLCLTDNPIHHQPLVVAYIGVCMSLYVCRHHFHTNTSPDDANLKTLILRSRVSYNPRVCGTKIETGQG